MQIVGGETAFLILEAVRVEADEINFLLFALHLL